ncbi:MAG: S41 family peptidase [Candidatus Moranbacteria bacterium]|nr:S41 family peptidase [Candidatus Moranbacteria bacterium]
MEQPTDPQNIKSLKFRQHFKVFVVVILVCVSFFSGVFYAKYKSTKTARTPALDNLILKSHDKSQPENVDFSLFWEAWNLLNEKYVDKSKLDQTKMIYGAISGMIKALGDPFSSFMDPAESQQFSDDLQGTFDGIGVEIGMKNDVLTVIAPLEGTPADKAGLRAGDKIIKIGDTITSDMSIDEAVGKIRGPKDTEISLTILREKDNNPKEIKIMRGTINVKSVRVEFKDQGIAIIKISKFGDDTTSEMNKAANQILGNKSRGIILDLRNNPGGYLESAVDVSSKFIPEGNVVVSEEDRNSEKIDYKARGGDILEGIPVVVLVNSGSASASEITAGALHDNLGSLLIGKKTFGKGSVQQLEKLSGGSNLRVTVARWLTPNGEYIMEKGISPEIEVDFTEDDYNNNRDPQLDKAIETLKSEIEKK